MCIAKGREITNFFFPPPVTNIFPTKLKEKKNYAKSWKTTKDREFNALETRANYGGGGQSGNDGLIRYFLPQASSFFFISNWNIDSFILLALGALSWNTKQQFSFSLVVDELIASATQSLPYFL